MNDTAPTSDLLTPTPLSDLRVGDLVDLLNDPYHADNDTTAFQFAVVAGIERETPECTRVDFEDGFDSAGYPNDAIFQVATVTN